MENLEFACQEFSTAAGCAANFNVTKHQFVAMFDEANGYPAKDIDDILAGAEPSVAVRIEKRLGAGIRHLDGLSFEHAVERVFFTCKPR